MKEERSPVDTPALAVHAEFRPRPLVAMFERSVLRSIAVGQKGLRPERRKLLGGSVLLAVLLAGCGTVTGSTGSTTYTSTAHCQQIKDALDTLAQVPSSLWNKPVSNLTSDQRQKLTSVSVPLTENASSAYQSLLEGPWASC